MRATPRHGRREGVVRFVKTLRRHYRVSAPLTPDVQRTHSARSCHTPSDVIKAQLFGGRGREENVHVQQRVYSLLLPPAHRLVHLPLII